MSSGGSNPLVNSWRRRKAGPPPGILRALRGGSPSAGMILPDSVAVDPPRALRRAAAREARRSHGA